VLIVFVGVTDPLAAGIVASLARRGGNVTGVAALVYSIGGKSLEMVKEAAPVVSRVAVLYNPAQVTQVGLLNTIKTVVPVGYSNSNVPMMKPTQDWQGEHAPYPLDVARNRRVLLQR
jgi:hypothetical protein